MLWAAVDVIRLSPPKLRIISKANVAANILIEGCSHYTVYGCNFFVGTLTIDQKKGVVIIPSMGVTCLLSRRSPGHSTLNS